MTEPSRAYMLRPIPRPHATHRLVCVPWSGAGPGVYNRWARSMPAEVELLAAVLPRSTAWHGDAAFSVEQLAEQLAYDLQTRYGDVEWQAVFGHSLGALVAFELATRLQPHARLDGVIVSGARAAHVDPPVLLHQLDDAGLVDALIELGGLRMNLRFDTRLLQRVLPRVRADLAACERYRPSVLTRLGQGSRLHAWSANGDWYAPPTSVQLWSELAHPGESSARTYGGDHFYINDIPADMLLTALGWPHGITRPRTPTLEGAA
ncbi:thioesterase II family protein [Lentzea sp. CA-135723]|uniref:thioesterase II family protein n=1 Tax=Lentzea sp. CA-135723 TaxID=3239950 RepID=UPI003D8A6EF8